MAPNRRINRQLKHAQSGDVKAADFYAIFCNPKQKLDSGANLAVVTDGSWCVTNTLRYSNQRST